MSELIIGRNSLLEALRAGRSIERLLLEEGAKGDPRIADIIRSACQGVAVERARGM
jgi:tRNA G18 (ribose-2'-O)-methylase SpoU